MDAEEEYVNRFIPSSLLPYSRRIEPEDPNVERLPGVYKGSMEHDVFSGGQYKNRHP